MQVEYAQDSLTDPTEKSGNKQAEWRTDPKRSGAGGALGDIGTHAYNLADYVTGLELSELAADLAALGEDRALDDNVQILLRYASGPRGSLWASQVAPGNEEQPDAARLWDEGRARVAAGEPEPALLVAAQRADPDHHTWRT